MVSRIQLALSLSGRPLRGCAVRIDGQPEQETDEHGCLSLGLADGRHRAVVLHDDGELSFEVAIAPGLRQVRVDIREEERPIDDEAVRRRMPSERYVPLRLVGRGGMGMVFKCRDRTLDRLVAVKILHEELTASKDARELFLSEARTLAAVQDPHLIDVHDLGFHEGRAFLVTRYVDGPDLGVVIDREGRLPAWSVAAAGVQLARALSAVHEAGLVHQDVKPGNGLVDRWGHVRLADFGLVTPVGDLVDTRSQVSGTPAYMSPELISGSQVGPASDVYALGATLFHMAAGHHPFADQAERLLFAHAIDAAPRLDAVASGVPRELADLVAATLVKKPSERPDTRSVADALVALARRTDESDRRPYLPRLVRTSTTADLTPLDDAGGGAARSRASWSVVTIADSAVVPGPDAVPTRLQRPPEVEQAAGRRGLLLPILVVVVGLVLLLFGLRLVSQPDPEPARSVEQAPVGTVEPAPTATPEARSTARVAPAVAPPSTPRPAPPPQMSPEATAEPIREVTVEPSVEPIVEPSPEPAAPTAAPTPEPAVSTAAPTPEPQAAPTPEAIPEPAPKQAPPPVSF